MEHKVLKGYAAAISRGSFENLLDLLRGQIDVQLVWDAPQIFPCQLTLLVDVEKGKDAIQSFVWATFVEEVDSFVEEFVEC